MATSKDRMSVARICFHKPEGTIALPNEHEAPLRLLSERSTYFRSKLHGELTSSNAGKPTVNITTPIAGVLSAVFPDYISYLNTGLVPECDAEHAEKLRYGSDVSGAGYAYFCYLYVLGHTIGDTQLQDAIIDAQFSRVQSYKGTPGHPLPSDNTVKFAIDHLPHDSPFLRFYRDLYVWAADSVHCGHGADEGDDDPELEVGLWVVGADARARAFRTRVAIALTDTMMAHKDEKEKKYFLKELKALSGGEEGTAVQLMRAIMRTQTEEEGMNVFGEYMEEWARMREYRGIPDGISNRRYHLAGEKRKRDGQEGQETKRPCSVVGPSPRSMPVRSSNNLFLQYTQTAGVTHIPASPAASASISPRGAPA